MAKLLYKLGTFIAKNKWLSVIGWLVILGVIITPLALNSPKFDDDITMNGLKSLDTNDKISKEFHQDSEKASMKIVFHSNREDGLKDKDTQKDIEDALDNIKQKDDYIQNISNPYDSGQVNKDGDTAIANISYVVKQTNMQDSSKKVIDKELQDVKDNHNIQIEKTQGGSMGNEPGGSSEIVGIVVAFIILLITFGSLIAAGMPIISAIIGLGSSVGIIALLTFVFDIPNFTLTLAVMIGLAVGIDYSLFILFRYKELKKQGVDTIEAIGKAVGTAGSAVIFAGLTVMMAVCGLSLVGIDFLAVMGFASAISVLFAVLAALTLLPALISIFHKSIKIKNKSTKSKDPKNHPWAKFIVGKPIIAVIISLVILILAAIPVSGMRLGIPDDGMKPNDTSEHKAYELISDNFGEGYNGQIVMLVNTKDGGSKKDIQRDLSNMRDDLKDLDNVDTVSQARLNDNNHYALFTIIPEKGPNAKSTEDLVYDLRDYHSQAQDKYHFDTEISGQSVINIDMSEKLNNAIPVFAGVIVVLAFLLLMVVFRSILVPLKAVLGFILSLMATLGFTTLVVQDGFLGGLFGVENTGPLLAFLPVITIGLLFGLAIDYELFLMTRVHEEYSKTGDNDHSIRVGIKESGPVIVAAALIMFSVFIAFVFQDDTMIKSMGISLAFGVLFDAFIVRMTLIPALTKLFGNASWYLPKWLGAVLPKIDVEGKALESDDHHHQTSSASEKGQEDTRYREFASPDKDTHHKQDDTRSYRNHDNNQPHEHYNNEDYNHSVSLNHHENESSHHYDKQHVDTQSHSNFDTTTNLYKDLTDNNVDQDVLFKALMLYARENNKGVYDRYNSQPNHRHDDEHRN
ncbi:MMPL family transporter [Staphylococcus pragensis]|uniref:MMPL family transporter n=1 Tax=Staphylococcus pragensis TaxID=1611836 RepID=A0A4Z1AXA0_9STAP|nr:MMPL family transporter [Staphylococcus pragensis]RTX90214.1 MMPL family transporter [Staphylococcus carnosus]TGN22298.1 MMPL family transporter [Staphylococcus pragensis]GGG98650.1 membrane protein [Staphylococcus pragensis]